MFSVYSLLEQLDKISAKDRLSAKERGDADPASQEYFFPAKSFPQMTEAGARALARNDFAEWDAISEKEKEAYRKNAKDCLQEAFSKA